MMLEQSLQESLCPGTRSAIDKLSALLANRSIPFVLTVQVGNDMAIPAIVGDEQFVRIALLEPVGFGNATRQPCVVSHRFEEIATAGRQSIRDGCGGSYVRSLHRKEKHRGSLLIPPNSDQMPLCAEKQNPFRKSGSRHADFAHRIRGNRLKR